MPAFHVVEQFAHTGRQLRGIACAKPEPEEMPPEDRVAVVPVRRSGMDQTVVVEELEVARLKGEVEAE